MDKSGKAQMSTGSLLSAVRAQHTVCSTSFHPPVTHPFTRCVFILVDGMPYGMFKGLVDSGVLPNIKQHIIDRGCLKKTTSVFPSTTGPAFIPFLMGLFPGTVNIPGIRWLSKREYQNPSRFWRPGICSYMGVDSVSFSQDLPDVTTLFDYFHPVSNIYSLLTKGCPPDRNRTRYVKLLSYGYAHLTDQWHVVDSIASHLLLKSVDAGDQFVMCLFPGVDTYSHLTHTQSDAVLEAYRHVDKTVGQICQRLHQSGELDETLLVLTSDHGMTNTHTHVDVSRHLNQSGWSCLHYPLLLRSHAECACLTSGNGMANVYVRGQANGWGGRLSYESLQAKGITDALLELEGVDLIAGVSERGHVVVEKPTGTGEIAFQDGLFSYTYEGRDPLHYEQTYEGLSQTEALVRTFESDYPDGLVQLWQVFQASRAGDLVVSAKAGYDLRARWEYPEHHATHGAMLAEQMLVPLAMSIPISAEHIRTVDVFPTILAQFDLPHPDGRIDGRAIE